MKRDEIHEWDEVGELDAKPEPGWNVLTIPGGAS